MMLICRGCDGIYDRCQPLWPGRKCCPDCTHASQPKRIQRKRTKGWRMPEGAVYVGRPTRWGNPIRVIPVRRSGPFDLERDGVGFIGQHTGLETARASAARRYCDLVSLGLTAVSVGDIREELRGHDLACWCPLDQPCHADVLLEVADG